MPIAPCRGRCGSIRVKKASNRPYHDGFKYCHQCDMWSKEPNVKCSCCHVPYRTTARDAGSRKKMTLSVTTKRY
jgi:hypothetical protein